jgi:AcrR family transcriptional regulator
MKLRFRQLSFCMARRNYQMKQRATAQDETRERIVRATMLLHDQQGVAATSFADIAKSAGVGPATVHRHFPNLAALVSACGAHVWEEMQPPVPGQAIALFAGLTGRDERLERLVEELDRFYRRGALRLERASADRSHVAELDGFLRAVEAGVADLVREALALESLPGSAIQLVQALMDFPVWLSVQKVEMSDAARKELVVRLLGSAIDAAIGTDKG